MHFGAHDICEEDWVASQLVRPSRFFFHPGYNPLTDDNDIAVLRLKREVRFGPKVCESNRNQSVPCQLSSTFPGLVDKSAPGRGQQRLPRVN